jgi:hypothetical protein
MLSHGLMFLLFMNVFLNLGITALIRPVPLDLALNTKILVNIAARAFVIAALPLSRKGQIGRPVGAILVIGYIASVVTSLQSHLHRGLPARLTSGYPAWAPAASSRA